MRPNLEIRSVVTPTGKLRLYLQETDLAEPRDDEILVEIRAAPINPADLLRMYGPLDPNTFSEGRPDLNEVEAPIPDAFAALFGARRDHPISLGSEGAGLVIDAGRDAREIIGRVVAFRSPQGTFALYRNVPVSDCLVLEPGASCRDGASASINPLTALAMVETMRREGHRAIIHTAAASSVGQILARVCEMDDVALINVVRSPAQTLRLGDMGARHVLDSSETDYGQRLRDKIAETGATIAFDAIGGGTTASTLLQAMEDVTRRMPGADARYGSPIRKQVYCYGRLDQSPTIIAGDLGSAWNVGGWLMTWACQTMQPALLDNLKRRVVAELKTTFVTRYAAEVGLEEMLLPTIIATFGRQASGEKYLLTPHGRAAAEAFP